MRKFSARRRAAPLLLLVVASLGVPARPFAASPTASRRSRPSTATLFISFGWFSGRNSEEKATAVDNDAKLNPGAGSKLGGAASMITNIENLQTAQRYGKLTATLLNELAATPVDGLSPDGKVRVTLNCQQRPVNIAIDEAYFEASDVGDVKLAVLAAMEEAYRRSIERMDERMKSFL